MGFAYKEKNGDFVFLQNTNIYDLVLLREVMVKPPWEARYGNKVKAWEEVAEKLSETKDATSYLLFKKITL